MNNSFSSFSKESEKDIYMIFMLIFLMAVGVLFSNKQGKNSDESNRNVEFVKVELASSDVEGITGKNLNKSTIISVKEKSGTMNYYVGGERTDFSEITPKLKGKLKEGVTTVLIHYDKKGNHGGFWAVYDECTKAGISKNRIYEAKTNRGGF